MSNPVPSAPVIPPKPTVPPRPVIPSNGGGSSGSGGKISTGGNSSTDADENINLELIDKEGIPFYYIINNDFFRIGVLIFGTISAEFVMTALWFNFEFIKWVFLITGT